MTEQSRRFVDVALPVPAPQPYTYHVPDELTQRVTAGSRVVVPLRNRELVGIVVKDVVQAPRTRTRPVLAAPDPEPALTSPLLRLAEWMAGYYGTPLGLALKSLLPGSLWGVSRVIVTASQDFEGAVHGRAGDVLDRLESHGPATITALRRWLGRSPYPWINRLADAGAVRLEIEHPPTGPSPKRERVVSLRGEPLSLAERETTFRRAPARRKAYEAIESLGGSASVRALREQIRVSDSVLRGLEERGLVSITAEPVRRDPFASLPTTPPIRTPTSQQESALETIGRTPRERTILLQGVTGSGKTFVYLDLVKRELAMRRGAIILVPEIALTPQTVARVRGMFGDAVGVLHSGLSDAERAEAWWALRRGFCRVAIGARSAVFAPIPDLGLVVVDEEHESTYKQSDAPRYHARDVARVRARIEGARVVLGSATPSLESWASGTRGEAVRVILSERVQQRPLPRVRLVDLRSGDLVTRGPVPWSTDLDVAITRALERGQQAMVFLNRRGFASFLQCPSCGASRDCPNCSVTLTVHRVPRVLRCHYCTFEAPVDATCSQCGASMERMRGLGTQQVEEFIAQLHPEAQIARMDLDTTSTKWAHHQILSAVANGDVDILVGTQMIAKGHDFPNVTVVGVIDADVGLHLPDFRAAERTFQLITQVAGRTGRGDRGGVVIVQTRSPEHYALMAAQHHDVDGFLQREFEVRASPAYPPVVALLRVLVQGNSETAVERAASAAADWIVAYGANRLDNALSVVGPAPAPIERVRRRWRWHLLVKAKESRALGHLVRAWVRDGGVRASGVQIQLDRDPIALL